jgi:mannosyltransferase OCH1-like enzyme
MSLENYEYRATSTDEFGTPDEAARNNNSKIPKIVFQTWKSHHEMPNNYRYWRETFLHNNPDFRCLLWDDADNRRFIEDKFPWFLTRYNSYPREIFRADIIRLFFLYTYGGFYADMDAECLKPLEGMRGMGDVLVGRMGYDNDFDHSIPNAIMASKSKQAFWLLTVSFAIERLVESQGQQDPRLLQPEWLTGPILLKDAVDFYTDHTKQEILHRISQSCPELATEACNSDFGQISILSPPIWYPVTWNNFIQTPFRRRMFSEDRVLDKVNARRLFPKAYIVTYWSASWK